MVDEFYSVVARNRDDSPDLRRCVDNTVRKLLLQDTSTKRPGILLGRIQSGKTRAFIGVIALAFDRGYDAAIVLTKGTVSLAKQTLQRIASDFKPFQWKWLPWSNALDQRAGFLLRLELSTAPEA
jgi:hypothetical protein